MRAFLGLSALLCAAGCGEDETVFRLEFEIGFDDAVEFNLTGVSLGDEPAPCNASGGLEVEPTSDNTVVNLPSFTEHEQTVRVAAGRYAFFVEGFDAAGDKVTQGCGVIEIAAARTDTLEIQMLPFTSEAVCGDGIRTGFEQCDDTNTAAGDGCSDTCQTEEQQANRVSTGSQAAPSIGVGVPFVFGFRSSQSINTRSLGPDGATRPMGWFNDQTVDGASGSGNFTFEQADVAVGGSRYVAAYRRIHNLGGGVIEYDIRASVVDWVIDDETAVTGDTGMAVSPDADGVEQDVPAVAMQDDGSFAVGWIEGANVMVSTFDDALAPVLAPTQIGTGATSVDLGALSGGSYVAAFDGGSAHAQRFDDTGEVGSEVTTGSAVEDVAVGTSFEHDELALVWIESDAVLFQAFSADGAPIGADPVFVSEAGTNSLPDVSGHGGHWFAVWGNGDIWGRYVESDGTFALSTMSVGPSGPSSSSFQINTVVDAAQSAPAVAMNAELALVVWTDQGLTAPREDLDGGGIRMRFLTEPAQ